jgi:hypothetical protein
VWIWKQFPRQIATDLRRFYPGTHIKHWHRGTRGADGDLLLSSYELLELLEHLPEDSAFKTQAERGGRWPDWKQMLAESVNESYRMHAAYNLVNGGEEASFDPSDYEFVDPVDRKRQAELDAMDEEAAEDAQERFESQIGFA